MEVFKIGVLNIGSKLLREKLEVRSSLSIVWHCARCGVYGKSVSH